MLSVKRRSRDIDEIQRDLKKEEETVAATGKPPVLPVDEDLPGSVVFVLGLRSWQLFTLYVCVLYDFCSMGQHYCRPCARHFVSPLALASHKRTKPHKKRLKVVAEEMYTQEEADRHAGMGAPVK